jgi:hypothetical protein
MRHSVMVLTAYHYLGTSVNVPEQEKLATIIRTHAYNVEQNRKRKLSI